MTRREETIKYLDSLIFEENTVIEYVPIYTVIKYLQEKGWTICDDEDNYMTNGWQVDYWFYILNPDGVKLCLEGSIFDSDGETIKIKKYDD